MRPKCKAWIGRELRYPCSKYATKGNLYCASHRPGKFNVSKLGEPVSWCSWREPAEAEGVRYVTACTQLAVEESTYCEAHLFLAALQKLELAEQMELFE